MDGGWAELHPWRVDPRADPPLFRQVYQQIRDAILSRALAPGARLPSSRDLATRLGVSRTSVVSAYDQLVAEGWLTARQGSGAYVSHDLPEPFAAGPRRPERPPPDGARFAPDRTSPFGPFVPSTAPGFDDRPFTMGRCLMDARAQDAWRRASVRAVRTMAPVHFGYTDPRGLPELRAAVCDYLRAARAVRCDPDQVMITSGTQHAIDIASRALLGPGDEVWIEDPSYPMTYRGLLSRGLTPRPVPVDDHGLIVASGIARAPAARAAVVTPSHQYPTGAVLSMARRLELLAWARKSDTWIIEDDYDSELRYRGRPLASMQGLDDQGRVIYVGTLNKVLFPGLRIGFAIIPRPILGAVVNARHVADRQPPTLSQTVLADFMREGHLTTHFRRMRQLYRQAQEGLVAELTGRIGDGRLRIGRPDQGNHLVAWLPHGVDDVAIEREAWAQGIACRAISRLYIEAPPRPGLMLGFTGFSPGSLVAAARPLADIILAQLDATRPRPFCPRPPAEASAPPTMRPVG